MTTDGSRWVAACALAETIGLGAAAAAARGGEGLDPRAALGLVVAGGLVEGTALGLAQSRVLAGRLPGLRRRAYTGFTVLVAGLGRAAASAGPVLSGDDSGSPPPLVLVLQGGAGIGLVMGPVLGGAQALALRGSVQAPSRWVLANTLAWPPVMVVIFLGAGTPPESWSTASVGAFGALTGAVAGTVLGLVTRPLLPLSAE
jgi:hypothetical protein